MHHKVKLIARATHVPARPGDLYEQRIIIQDTSGRHHCNTAWTESLNLDPHALIASFDHLPGAWEPLHPSNLQSFLFASPT